MNFEEIIGQSKAKSRLNFHFDAFVVGEALPSIMFCAPRGFGKTTIAESFGAKVREVTNGTKRVFTVNSAAIKNLKSFWESVVWPHINDRDITLVLDECSELPADVTMALLTMINPNPQNRNSFTYDDMTLDVDLKRQTFIFATTEPHRVFPALMNRCRRIDLESYTYTELSNILRRNAKGIIFGQNVLGHISPTLRGVARQAVMMGQDIRTYLAPLKRTTFGMQDWRALSSQLDVLPLGLTRLELQVLRILEVNRDCSLTRIAATLGMTPSSVQKDLELYLMKSSLLEIGTEGRNLTPQGAQYLKDLDAIKK